MKNIMAAATTVMICASVGAQEPSEVHYSPRVNYMTRCGGCHGLEGRSASALIPDLKDRAGYFLCTRESREYVGRLPNVVFSQISDEEMAALLNYVAFVLGAGSAPANAPPYSAEEVARLRQAPLTVTNLLTYRRKVVARLISTCGAPKALRSDYRPARAP